MDAPPDEVTGCCSEPSQCISQISSLPLRSDENARCRPSGDHDGSSLSPSKVSWAYPSPVGAIVQTWNFPRIRETKAIRSPRGDQAGEVL